MKLKIIIIGALIFLGILFVTVGWNTMNTEVIKVPNVGLAFVVTVRHLGLPFETSTPIVSMSIKRVTGLNTVWYEAITTMGTHISWYFEGFKDYYIYGDGRIQIGSLNVDTLPQGSYDVTFTSFAGIQSSRIMVSNGYAMLG